MGNFRLSVLPQGRIKETRKQRRQQGSKVREAEIARADAADLAAQLRKVILLPSSWCVVVFQDQW